MVGNLIGSRAAQEQAVVGETPNLAARLQAAAVPSAIAIDQTTRRLLVRSGPPGPPRQAIDDRLPVATIRDAHKLADLPIPTDDERVGLRRAGSGAPGCRAEQEGPGYSRQDRGHGPGGR
jgi:class 3 adenylate cyclase